MRASYQLGSHRIHYEKESPKEDSVHLLVGSLAKPALDGALILILSRNPDTPPRKLRMVYLTVEGSCTLNYLESSLLLVMKSSTN